MNTELAESESADKKECLVKPCGLIQEEENLEQRDNRPKSKRNIESKVASDSKESSENEESQKINTKRDKTKSRNSEITKEEESPKELNGKKKPNSKSVSRSVSRSISRSSRSSRSRSSRSSSRSSRSRRSTSRSSSRSSYVKKRKSKKKSRKRRKYSTSRSRSRSSRSRYSSRSVSRSSYSRSRSRSYTRSRSSSRTYSSRSVSSRSRSPSYSRSASSRSSRSRSGKYRSKNSRNRSYSSSSSRSRSRSRKSRKVPKSPKLTSSARQRPKHFQKHSINNNHNPTSAIPFMTTQSFLNKNRFNFTNRNAMTQNSFIANRNKNPAYYFNRNIQQQQQQQQPNLIVETNQKAKSAILSHLNLNIKAKEELEKRKLKAKLEKEANEKMEKEEEEEEMERKDDSPAIPITSFQNETDSDDEEVDEENRTESPNKKQKLEIDKKVSIEDEEEDEEEKEKTKNILNVFSKLNKKKLSNQNAETKKAPIIKAGQISKLKIEEAPVTVNKFIGPKLPYYTKQAENKPDEQTETESKVDEDKKKINYSKDELAKYDELLKMSQMYAKYNQVGVVNVGPNGEGQISMVELDQTENIGEHENPIQLNSNELKHLTLPEDVTLKQMENDLENYAGVQKVDTPDEKLQNEILQQHQHQAQQLILQQQQHHHQLSQPLTQSLQYLPIQNQLQHLIQIPNQGLGLGLNQLINPISLSHLNNLQTFIQSPGVIQQPILFQQNPGLPFQYVQAGQQLIQLRHGLPTIAQAASAYTQPQYIINSPFYRILPQ